MALECLSRPLGLVGVIFALFQAGCGSESASTDESSIIGQDLEGDTRIIRVPLHADLDEFIRGVANQDGPLQIELLPGEYHVRSEIQLGTAVTIIGAGPNLTRLVAAAELPALLTNAGGERGNRGIRVIGLMLDCSNQSEFGADFIRVSEVRISDVEVTGCISAGIRVSGRGQITRGGIISNVVASNNNGDGLYFMWAIRNIQYSNISSFGNGGRGIIFDHSEFQSTNISACDNAGNGIYLRNFFGANLDGLYSCRNGGHGIFIEGMVASTGAGWVAQSNSRRTHGEFDEIHFAGGSELSYGDTRESAVIGVAVGSFWEGYGEPTARCGIFVGESVRVNLLGSSYGPTLDHRDQLNCGDPAP